MAADSLLRVALALGLLHLVVLGFQLPLLAGLPDWLWGFEARPVGAFWPLGLWAAAGALAVWRAGGPEGRRGWLALLVVFGYLAQLCLGFVEGRGIAAVSARLATTGHAELAEAAVRAPGPLELVRDYERLVDEGVLGRYAATKPPGHLLLYVCTERLAGWGDERAEQGARLRRLRTFAAWTWPLVAALAVVPLAWLARLGGGGATERVAVPLYLLTPAFCLITLHADQVFFPSLFMLAVGLVGLGAREGKRSLALAGGAALWVGLFCSLSLVAAVPVAAVVALGLARGRLGVALGSAAAGFAAADLAARVFLGYDMLARVPRALAAHHSWSGWTWALSDVAYYAFLNAIEFAAWVGAPLAVFAVARVGAAFCATVTTRALAPRDGLAVAVGATFVGLALLGAAKGEACRLWLFLVPACAVLAAQTVADRFPGRERGVAWLLFAVQAATVLLTKLMQDFG